MFTTLFDAARERLASARAPREALGAWKERRILGIARPPVIVEVGSAWHLGVLLLGEEKVFATGEIVRAHDEVRRGFTAVSQRERFETAVAAFRGGFAEGQVVHIGWSELDPDHPVDPLRLSEGTAEVRWGRRAGWRSLAAYLDEQIALLLGSQP